MYTCVLSKTARNKFFSQYTSARGRTRLSVKNPVTTKERLHLGCVENKQHYFQIYTNHFIRRISKHYLIFANELYLNHAKYVQKTYKQDNTIISRMFWFGGYLCFRISEGFFLDARTYSYNKVF